MKNLIAALLLASCISPATDRTKDQVEVGVASAQGISLVVENQQGAVRELSRQQATVWAQAPALTIQIDADADGDLNLTILNCMTAAEAKLAGQSIPRLPAPHPTHCEFVLPLVQGANQVDVSASYSNHVFNFASLGDIQEAMSSVDEVFQKISETPGLDFVVSTGDISNDGTEAEYDLYEKQLESLNIPIFSTLGNHDISEDPSIWQRRYGRFSLRFSHRGTDFSYMDSGNASIDPSQYDVLQTWLEESKNRLHIFGTHFPPVDPVGVRFGSFRSRNEALKLLAMLAKGNVDLTMYGHIHSFYEFENAGIPAFISGGGGALPENYDGVGRHFLVVTADSQQQKVDVEKIEVD